MSKEYDMKILKELKDKYEIKDIETAFIVSYVSTNSIAVKNNLLIKSIIENEREKTIEIRKIISRYFKQISLFDLVRVFELLITEEDKRINGAFFTPHLITRFIASECQAYSGYYYQG